MGLEALGQLDDSGKALTEFVQPSKPRERTTSAPSAASPTVTTGRHAAYAQKAFDGEVARLRAMADAATPDGTGYSGAPWDITTFEVACNLLELANADWTSCTVADAVAAVRKHAPLDSGFTYADVDKKIASAGEKVGDKARPVPPERVDFAAEIASWDIACEVAPVKAHEPAPSRFPRVDWDELFSRDVLAEPDWLLEPLVERGTIVACYSPPKEGKSLVTLDAVAAAASGRSVFGFPPREPITVIYIDRENSETDLLERLTAFGYDARDLGRLVYLSFADLPPLDTVAGGAALEEINDTYGGDLVVFDTVSRFIEGEEDAADTWAKAYQHSLMRLKARGVAVLRLDHAGKDVRKGQRGSSAKSADVDAVWRLQASGRESRTLIREATRNGHGPDRLRLTVQTAPMLRHVAQTMAGVDAAVAALVAELDELGLPRDAGRHKAREALEGTTVKAANSLLEEALRVRKARPQSCPNPRGQVVSEADQAPARDAARDGDAPGPTTSPLTCGNDPEEPAAGRSAGRSGRSSSGPEATCPSAPVPMGRAGSPSPAHSKECGGCGSPYITRADSDRCIGCQQAPA